MRRIYLFLFFIICFSYVSARPVLLDTARVYIGTSHGVIGSGIFFNPSINNDLGIILGYNGGILVNYSAEKKRALQVELNFSQRGWKETKGSKDFYVKRLNYLEMPFLAQYYWGEKNRFILNLGPKISFLISEKTVTDNTHTEENYQEEHQHIEKIQNKFDYGVSLGAGYQLSVKKQIFQFEVRGYFSLGTIYKNGAGNAFSNSNHANVSANLGWMFRVR